MSLLFFFVEHWRESNENFGKMIVCYFSEKYIVALPLFNLNKIDTIESDYLS